MVIHFKLLLKINITALKFTAQKNLAVKAIWQGLLKVLSAVVVYALQISVFMMGQTVVETVSPGSAAFDVGQAAVDGGIGNTEELFQSDCKDDGEVEMLGTAYVADLWCIAHLWRC